MGAAVVNNDAQVSGIRKWVNSFFKDIKILGGGCVMGRGWG